MLFHQTDALNFKQLLSGTGTTSPTIQHRPEHTPNPTLARSYVSINKAQCEKQNPERRLPK